MRKGKTKKGVYSEEYKKEVMMLIQANGGNISKTAKEIGMDKSTIFKWWKGREGYVAKEEIKAVEKMTNESIDKFNQEHPDFIQRVYEVKYATLNRILMLIKKEKNLEKLASVYKAVCIEGGEDKPQSNLTVFKQINNTLIQQGYGKKTDTDQGD